MGPWGGDRAREVATGDKVAIKVVKTKRYTEKQRADLIREVVVLSGVHHPFVVAYRHSFYKAAAVYIVMEYAERGTLKANLAKDGRKLKLSERRIMRYFVQILLALMHLHREQILHRDLKTENIFVAADGSIKLNPNDDRVVTPDQTLIVIRDHEG